jgi:ankyrin repeat protein
VLIDRGANVNAPSDGDNRPPLAFCLKSGDAAEAIAMVELLLEKGAGASGRTNPKEWTLLHTLVQGGQTLFPDRVRVAEMLIARGADVNATAGEGEEAMTPLDLAGEDDPDPLVRLLKSKGGKRRQ